jgi:MFS family permease
MTDLVVSARTAAVDTQPTGPIGRVLRLVVAALAGASLLSIVDQRGLVGFRDPSVATELMVWFLTAVMLAVFATLVGALATAAGRRSPWHWRLAALALFAAAAVGAALIGQIAFGRIWGFPLADLVWGFDVVMLVQTIVASLIAIVIGMPGCEVGVWPALLARARGGTSVPVAGPACIVGLDLIDHWEARRRQRTPDRIPAREERRAGGSGGQMTRDTDTEKEMTDNNTQA